MLLNIVQRGEDGAFFWNNGKIMCGIQAQE
jgi:hypothetical protein